MITTFSAGAAILAPCRGCGGFLRVMITVEGFRSRRWNGRQHWTVDQWLSDDRDHFRVVQDLEEQLMGQVDLDPI